MPKRELSILLIVFLILAALVSFAAFQFFSMQDLVEINTIKVIDSTILIGHNCTGIIAQTTPDNAESIQAGLDRKIRERPTAHDTVAQIFKTFNITVEGVEIIGIQEQNYLSNIIVRQIDRVLKLDSRPSDAIAIALRMNSSIYINRTLLQEKGEDICLT